MKMDKHLRGVAGSSELNALSAGTSREVAGQDEVGVTVRRS